MTSSLIGRDRGAIVNCVGRMDNNSIALNEAGAYIGGNATSRFGSIQMMKGSPAEQFIGDQRWEQVPLDATLLAEVLEILKPIHNHNFTGRFAQHRDLIIGA